MSLPHDVLVHIFTLLPPTPVHLLRLRCVCRTLRTLSDRNFCWHVLALEQWRIVDAQQRPRQGETWRDYYIETYKMLRKSDDAFVRAAVERGLVAVVAAHLDVFRRNVVQHLRVAIQHVQPSIVKLLVPLAPRDALGGGGLSPLRLAIRANRVAFVELLLNAGADASAPSLLPPLCYAAQRGASAAMLELLLARCGGRDGVRQRASDGQTPLHHALACALQLLR